MMKVLLVGEDINALRLIALDLSVRGLTVAVVTERDELLSFVEASRPDVVILDHVEPLDVYVLNPRQGGYEGSVILLIDQDLPSEFIAFLRPSETVKKPLQLEVLVEHLQRIAVD